MNRPAPARPAPAAVPVVRAAPVGLAQFQRTLRVSSPRDPAEREAESTSARIMRMAEPPYVARFADSIAHMQRYAAAQVIARRADGGAAGGDVTTGIAASGTGAPLPASVRGFMEPRFGADFSAVRIHTGDRAAQLNRQVSAQAFTVGNQIFFGRDRFQPETHDGKALIAHELTHTIQQGAVQQGTVQSGAAQPGTAQRQADVEVTQRTGPEVQRLGVSDALDYFADAANNIPGYRMFTIILGVNPINMSRVDRSAANILRAIVEFIPGGGLIVQALDAYGVFERAGRWIEQQLASLGISGASIREAINRFLDSLGWRDIFRLGDVWNRARRIFTDPIDRIIQFVRSLGAQILRMIKDAILRPLAQLASQTRAWDLLCAVLGQNPITGEAVPRTAETLIGGFMRLIGQEELWQNIQRANALGRAWTWFQGALNGLMGFVRQIPQLFLQALQALEIADIVLLPRAFARVASVFGSFIGNFLSWAGNTVWNLLEIIFEVVAPSVMVYLRRAAGAFRTILRDPIGFARNLLRAAVQGFRQFATNFLTHLRASLIGWLTGAMSGANIYIPQSFLPREILKFVLSVLGLTWQNIRQKLVRAVGETAVRVLETGFDIVMTLVTQGPAAAWERIQEMLSNLREMVIEQIMTFVRDRVVTAAVTRLLSMLSPVGAFIQAIIATYNTVMFFVERLRQIAQVAASFIDSISAIASGVIASAANRVEQTMAGLLTLVISFLARIAGLGRVTDAVTSVIDRVRQPIDRALDRVVDWIVATARRLGRLVVDAVSGGPDRRTAAEKENDLRSAVAAVQQIAPERRSRILLVPALLVIKRRYRLTALEVTREAGAAVTIRAAVNPEMMFDLPGRREQGAERWIADRLLQASRTQLRLLRREDTITQATAILEAAFRTITGLPAGSRLRVIAQSEGRAEVRVLLAEEPARDVLVGRIIPPNEGFVDIANPDPLGLADCARHIRTRMIVVKDARGAYLGPRVIRDLNETDARRLRRAQGIEPAAPSSRASLLQHVEGADSNFTSASRVPRTEHMRSGTRDETGAYRLFFDPASGRVEINLFRIRSADIFDLSTRVAQQHWGIFGEGATGAQEQAMRDTLRTMEVLIRGEIPYNAVRFLNPPTRPPRGDPY